MAPLSPHPARLGGAASTGRRAGTDRAGAGRMPGRVGGRLREVLRRRVVIRSLIVGVLLIAGWFAIRDASPFAVRDVSVVGLRSSRAETIRRTLDQAAQGMTVTHLRPDALMRAVRPYPEVADVRIDRRGLHAVRLHVVSRPAVAVVASGDTRVPVAGDGTLLRGASAVRVATIAADSVPAGARVTGGRIGVGVAALAAAPADLRARVSRVRWGTRGLLLDLHDGPVLVFGDAVRVHAKWMSAARVMAEPSATGATEVDVRVPERPTAGGVGPVPDPEAGGSGTTTLPEANGLDTPASTAESTAAP